MNKQLLIFILIQMLGPCAFALNLEGKSSYFKDKEIERVNSELTSSQMGELDAFEVEKITCEYEYFKAVRELDGDINLSDSLIYLRGQGRIDDTKYRLINRSLKSFQESLKDKHLAPLYRRDKDFDKSPYKKFNEALEKGQCFNLAYKNLVSSIGETKKAKIIKSLKVAYRKKQINKQTYWQLKRLAQDQYQDEPKSLLDYIKVQASLTRQFPSRVDIEASDYISGRKSKKSKVSRRELFLAKYNQFQIIYLRKMMDRLLNRLNADEVTISVIIDDEVVEEILLDPLEQYRFAAKMIRKELGDLQVMSLFNGTNVTFEDLLAAGFETALVSGSDLATLELVEDVWNPELTKSEKRKKFIKKYGTIFAAALPTSVYFVKVLSLVGIEMLTKTKEEPKRDHSIF